jgi:hypothetical protein
MDMGGYRVEVDRSHKMRTAWAVMSEERGVVGVVSAVGNGKFAAMVDNVPVASVPSVKAAVEQVIWYDRAIHQEIE